MPEHSKPRPTPFSAPATWDVSEKFRLGAGIRYSHDKKDLFLAERSLSSARILGVPPLGPIYADPVTRKTTWDLTATYFMNDEINWYARVATGFRAPSIQGRLLFGDTVSVADSETSTSYEGGVKMFLAGGKARVNFNLFSYTVEMLS